MKRYTEYKDSGIAWIGEIPKDWSVSRIGYESWVRARLGWKGLKAEEYVDEGYAFLSTPNIKGVAIDFINVNYISQERYDESPEIKLSIGDILLAKDGSTLGTVNVVRTLPRESTVNSSIAVITPNDNVFSVYLYYLFQTDYITNLIQMKKNGMGVPHLFQADIVKFKIPLPPVVLQKKIANHLDIKTAAIDALITDKQKLIDLLKEKRQAIISEAVTKGLYKNSKMKDSGIEWIGEMPEGWEVIKLKYLCNIKRGASPRPIDDPIYFDDDGERYWVRISDVTASDKYLLECEQKLSQLGIEKSVKIDPNNLFVSICASVGKPCISKVKACIHDGFVLFDGLDDSLIDYTYSLFETGLPYKGLGKLGTQLNLNSETIGNIFIPIHNGIQKIMRFIGAQTTQIDSLISDIQAQIEKLKEYRQSVISEAVTGKVAI